MGPEGIILANSPITNFQQSLTHSAMAVKLFFSFRWSRGLRGNPLALRKVFTEWYRIQMRRALPDKGELRTGFCDL